MNCRLVFPGLILFCAAVALAQDKTRDRAGPTQTVRAAGIVLKWVRGDKEANYRRAEPMIREAAAHGARIVCTTECFLDGYAIADKSIPLDVYRALGEPIPQGDYFRRLSRLAGELRIYLIAGMLEADGEARYNTAAIIGPEGELVGKYHKQVLEHEAVRNTAGTESTSVRDAAGQARCDDLRGSPLPGGGRGAFAGEARISSSARPAACSAPRATTLFSKPAPGKTASTSSSYTRPSSW